jgi:hypothetical protein
LLLFQDKGGEYGSMALSEASKEKIKLRANFLNNLAVGFFIGGFLGPIVTAHLGDEIRIYAGILSVGMSVVLHIYATRHLSEIDHDDE